ncbi:MAG TPA: DUF2993 domain-containing protein [Cyanobacteria bacterium UBA11162]|nr:DUF2993 domain-containing protein [Cyanobacteria bacterium UBA11162]
MTQQTSGLGEQALEKIAEIGLSTQLDEVERLDVAINTDPGKLVQGELESLTINADGLVMQEDLRMEKMTMQINSLAINPLKALIGNLELTQPAQGIARVVITEADINRALESEFLSNQIRNLTIQVEGKPVTIDTQNVTCHLLDDGKVGLDAEILIRQTGEIKVVSFTTTPHLKDSGQGISLDNIQYIQGKELSPELTKALVEKATELLNVSNFEMDGISLQLHQLNVEAGRLTLQAEAYVTQIPETN